MEMAGLRLKPHSIREEKLRMSQTPVADRIRAKLQAAFAPDHMELLDDSARHAGHAGASAAGESHFRLVLRAAAFNGKSRVARQKMVFDALAEEMAGRVHAFSMQVEGTET